MDDLDDAKFVISIHAPREGGDAAKEKAVRAYFISSHAPREGGDTPLLSRLTG